MTERKVSFVDMVLALFKTKGYNVKMEALVHASVGVIGEAVELMFSDSAENMIEEFGDEEFYVEATLQAVIALYPEDRSLVTRELFNMYVIQSMENVEDVSVSDLVYYGNEVLDFAKKLWVYNKPQEEVMDKLLQSLAALKAHLLALYEMTHLTEDVIRGMNQTKLIYGTPDKPARYPGIAYTDAAAQARADKVGE